MPLVKNDEHSSAVLPAASRRRHVVFPSAVSKVPLSLNLHFLVCRVPMSIRRTEIETVFPALHADNLLKSLPLFVVLTFQPTATVDMSQFTEEAQTFKDFAMSEFFVFFDEFKRQLLGAHASSREAVGGSGGDASASASAWPVMDADFGKKERLADDLWINASDPPTGLPYLTEFGERGSTAYDEVSGMEEFAAVGKVLINTQWGPCHMACHPTFGVNMYPATFFVAGSQEVVLATAARLAAAVES